MSLSILLTDDYCEEETMKYFTNPIFFTAIFCPADIDDPWTADDIDDSQRYTKVLDSQSLDTHSFMDSVIHRWFRDFESESFETDMHLHYKYIDSEMKSPAVGVATLTTPC